MASWDLERFVQAQDQAGTYPRALSELAAGHKQTHWMWFIFPQLASLGHSPTARYYAVSGLEEARAYLAHPVLGARLRECVQQLQDVADRSATDIFGSLDAMKLRSSLTLFAQAAPREPQFAHTLERYFAGPDPHTLNLLGHATAR